MTQDEIITTGNFPYKGQGYDIPDNLLTPAEYAERYGSSSYTSGVPDYEAQYEARMQDRYDDHWYLCDKYDREW